MSRFCAQFHTSPDFRLEQADNDQWISPTSLRILPILRRLVAISSG
jgi:hypothetical protein